MRQEMTGFWDVVTSAGQSAPRFRQITTPTPQHSIFTGWMLFLTPNQQCQSTEGQKQSYQNKNLKNSSSMLCIKL